MNPGLDHLQTFAFAITLALAPSTHAAMPSNYRGRPFDDQAYRARQHAEIDRPALPLQRFTQALVVWNGTTATNGTGWIHGAKPGSSVSLEPPDADGKPALHFHAAAPNYRDLAFGWERAATHQDGINNRQFAAISFDLKITGAKKMQELFLGLHKELPGAASIRHFQPGFLDGSWHRVTIPLHAIQQEMPPAANPTHGFTLRTFVWDQADFDVFVANVSFDTSAGSVTQDTPLLPPPDADRVASGPGQPIPGRLECAFYDLGGESVAYHDTTPINILSAVLNQQPIHQRPHATRYHWNFRREEGVDISFVKDFADLNHPNQPDPPVNQLYIGGTEDGEWCNYTVDVKTPGTYGIIATYGNVAGMKPLRFSVNGTPAAECPCPVITGSMHKWTRQAIGLITFPGSGPHLLTLHYGRGYNLACFDFEAATQPGNR